MSKKTKKWLTSTGITFLTGFCLALAPFLDNITLDTIKTGAIWAILFVCLRTGIKLVVEAFLNTHSK